MIGVRVGVPVDAVRSDARHVLFVEGGGDDAIDRDHHNDDFVEQSWHNFPDSGSRNLLVWRKREIENYFLDPDYLARSKYFIGSVNQLRQFVMARAQHRLYIDVTNSVIVSLREVIKKNRVQTFTDPGALPTRDVALQALTDLGMCNEFRCLADQELANETIQAAFDDTLCTMTGETDVTRDQLRLGSGKWIDMMRGKKLFAEIVASNLFRVDGRDGNPISGARERNAVARELLQRDDVTQPPDFEQLKHIIMQMTGAGLKSKDKERK